MNAINKQNITATSDLASAKFPELLTTNALAVLPDIGTRIHKKSV